MSIGAALPVISAMGVECVPLPTAVLSSHTAFQHFHFHDMTDQMDPIAGMWQLENQRFDVICTGYLGSVAQIDIVCGLIDRFGGEGVQVIIDPVMGDHGKLYSRFDDTFVSAMRRLVARADVVLPNLTEAAALLGIPYDANPDAEQLARRLTGLGAKCAVITGVRGAENRLGAAVYDAQRDVFSCTLTDELPGSYFGTGDIFAAVLSAALAKGAAPEKALQLAVDFVSECIRATLNDPEARNRCTSFQLVLGKLAQWAQNIQGGN
jgi:pyridoxine kinase